MPAIAAALTTSSGGRASTGRSVETVARVPVLLVETDYDGTLAEIVSDPAMALPVRESIVGLRALATLGSTHATVISGRSLADLAALSALDAAALTIGLAGLPGREGGFFLCVSWLVDALWKAGRQADAEALFESIVELAGPEGLLPEQYDPLLGRTLGNHPQAYSLIGLIENTLILLGA